MDNQLLCGPKRFWSHTFNSAGFKHNYRFSSRPSNFCTFNPRIHQKWSQKVKNPELSTCASRVNHPGTLPPHFDTAQSYSHCLVYYFLQEPQEKKIGKPYYVEQFSGTKRRKVLRSDTFYYVSLLDTLKLLLTNKEIQSEVTSPHHSSTKLEDF